MLEFMPSTTTVANFEVFSAGGLWQAPKEILKQIS